MARVEITRPIIADAGVAGLVMMQVCAVADATDEEILEVCNLHNPCGTTNGWSSVVREVDPDSMFRTENTLPVTCEEYPDRKHFVVLC